jgi:hypothetical protein
VLHFILNFSKKEHNFDFQNVSDAMLITEHFACFYFSTKQVI